MNTAPTILVCDDEAAIRQLVATKLRSAGYVVVEARNGLEGYCCCDHSAAPPGTPLRTDQPLVPSLVITDLQMPAMSGIEMAARLRSFAPTSAVPILMLTARGYVLGAEEVAKTNVKSLMAKPFGGRQLLEQVNTLLNASTSKAA